MVDGMRANEIPKDDEVIQAVGTEQGGASPTEVLNRLLDEGHTRANAQRAIQRVLDRGKVAYNHALRLVVVIEIAKLAA